LLESKPRAAATARRRTGPIPERRCAHPSGVRNRHRRSNISRSTGMLTTSRRKIRNWVRARCRGTTTVLRACLSFRF